MCPCVHTLSVCNALADFLASGHLLVDLSMYLAKSIFYEAVCPVSLCPFILFTETLMLENNIEKTEKAKKTRHTNYPQRFISICRHDGDCAGSQKCCSPKPNPDNFVEMCKRECVNV